MSKCEPSPFRFDGDRHRREVEDLQAEVVRLAARLRDLESRLSTETTSIPILEYAMNTTGMSQDQIRAESAEAALFYYRSIAYALAGHVSTDVVWSAVAAARSEVQRSARISTSNVPAREGQS